MRPTTKDLAKAAGVSLATIDRVLNGRSGVRQKTVDAVNEAIERTGFQRNQVAATLARQKGYRFGFVLPRTGDEFLDVIIKHISEFDQASRAEMIATKVVRIDDHDPHRAAKTLSRLSADDYDGIAIMAPETPQIRDALYRMRERGIQTVAFISNQQEEGSQPFVGIDNIAAGATAGRLMNIRNLMPCRRLKHTGQQKEPDLFWQTPLQPIRILSGCISWVPKHALRSTLHKISAVKKKSSPSPMNAHHQQNTRFGQRPLMP